MLISAWAMSASSRSKIGSPQPGGTPVATTVTSARSSPLLAQAVHVGLEPRDHGRVGPEEGVLLDGSQLKVLGRIGPKADR